MPTTNDSCNSQHVCCSCRPLRRRRSLALASVLALMSAATTCSAFTARSIRQRTTSQVQQLQQQDEPRSLLSVLNMVSFLEAPSSASISRQQQNKGRKGSSSSGGKRLVKTDRSPPTPGRIEIDITEYAAFDFDNYVVTSSAMTREEQQQTIGVKEEHHVVPDIDSEILYEGFSGAVNEQPLSSDNESSQMLIIDDDVDDENHLASSSSRPKVNRSSTMPGFVKDENLDSYIGNEALRRLPTKRKITRMVRSKAAKLKRRQINSEALYKKSAAVPESLCNYAHEIHAISRVTPKEEKELGTKTQEAIRLQRMYDDLQGKYGRDPTDEEWCAAAGKINMEALREAIEDGMEAKNQLVASNLRMVQRVVNLYIRNGLGSEYNAGDLMQDGTMVSSYFEWGY